MAHWKSLVEKYPIYSIEDGLDEDWEGWQILTKELGDKIAARQRRSFCNEYGTSLQGHFSWLRQLNPDQTESRSAPYLRPSKRSKWHNAGYTAVTSHRSGETEDTAIADLAVALNTCQIRT